MTHKEVWAISLTILRFFGRKLKELEAQTILIFLLDRRKLCLGKKKENVEWVVNHVTGTKVQKEGFLNFCTLAHDTHMVYSQLQIEQNSRIVENIYLAGGPPTQWRGGS